MRARFDIAIEAIVAGLMAIMCLTVFVGVVFRYVLVNPLTWTEEVARLCLVWITFLGIYLGYRRKLHISIDVIRTRMSLHSQRVIHIVVTVLLAGLMGTLIIYGAEYSRAFLASVTPLLGIPLGLIYSALPVSAALLLWAVLVELVELLRGRALFDTTLKGDLL
jgi:TRAP-type transport system small permease protein